MTGYLKEQLAKLKQGDHICLIYETTAEQLAAVVAFIIEGLARGERCVYITDDRKIEEAIQTLKAAGVDVVKERQRGALRLLTSQDTYLRGREFVPQTMISVIRDLENEAVADGFSGLRLTGEPTWSFGPVPGCDRLIEYEALLNQLPTNSKSVLLCQYQQSLFGLPCIHDVLRTHPVAILGDQVCPNPYYESPELVMRNNQAGTTPEHKAEQVDWWIAQLRRASTAEQEHERALKKLKQSERRFAEAQQIAHIGSWERDLRTNELNWSDELYRVFGLQPNGGNFSYQQFLNHISPQDVDRIRTVVDEAIRERRDFSCDYRITLPSGSVRVLNDRGSVILNEEGEPMRLVGTAQDVTKLRKAEQAQQELKRQKEVLQTIFDNIPVMINFVDAAGRIKLLNRHWEKVLGWSWEEARNLDMFTEIYPDPQYRHLVLEYVRAANPGWCDFKTRVRDGRTIDTAWANVLLSDGTSIGIGRDVTEIRQAEQELNRQKTILQTIFDHIPMMISFVDAAGRVQMVNKHCERVLGWSLEEAQARDLTSECYPDPDYRARVTEYIRHPKPGLTELKIRTRDGRMIDTIWVVTLLPDGTRIWFGDDVTERNRVEKEIREYSDSVQALSRQLLKVQEEERRHLARELHDEFGQVLATITLHLHAARSLAGAAAHPRLDECAALLRQAGDQVRNLALELRPTTLETFGLDATLRGLAEQHQRLTGADVQVVGELSGTAISGELAIACFRVTQEALTNILRHAAARNVWIELSQSEGVLELIVRDDGRGFDMSTIHEQATHQGRLGLLGMRGARTNSWGQPGSRF